MGTFKTTLSVCFIFLFLIPVFAQNNDSVTLKKPVVIHANKHDISRPLREIPPKPVRAGIKRERINPSIPTPPDQPGLDPNIQTFFGGPEVPSTGQNFEGIGEGLAGYSVNLAPPDTNGDVGPNHYVQIVNVSFAVWNKSGTKLYGPALINTLWSGFGGICETHNNGDPTVVYDPIANRWVIAQFALANPNYAECVAVSTTADPTGTWNRYSFPFTQFNDYPKMGVWPDGYYTTYNLFGTSGSAFTGPEVCAFDRVKILNNQPATAQCFQLSTAYASLLPADLDGATTPPAGSPNYLISRGGSALNFWKFHVDWANPANTTFSSSPNFTIPVNAYSTACGGGSCIPQLNTTQLLASLGDRLMNRLAYRKFSDHESLVVSHSITASGSVGMRWYEIRNPSTTPTMYQQGTYSPDATYRWMGSAAMDQSGDIGLGFSASSSSIHPAIRYAGRLVSDPLGTMGQGEGTIINGTGSQIGGLARWGDYSDLAVDPADDCTFWYTTEYLTADGNWNWHTRIASFKFASCGGGSTCTPPSGFNNNTAADVSNCLDSGVRITWNNPTAWGDSGGTRTHDVLRNGVVIASGLSAATTSFTDTTGTNGTTYTYTVRHNNGCGSSATTSGASAADNISAPPVTEAANQSVGISAKNSTATSALTPALTTAAGQATSASITWSLSGANLTACAVVSLRAPDSTQTTLKAAGSANTGSANVTSFYNSKGPGTYTVVLQELAGCGKANQRVSLSGTSLSVQHPGACN